MPENIDLKTKGNPKEHGSFSPFALETLVYEVTTAINRGDLTEARKIIDSYEDRYKKLIGTFSAGLFEKWHGKRYIPDKISISTISPAQVDFEKLATSEADTSSYGEITSNQDTALVDYGKKEAKIFISDAGKYPEYIDQPRYEVIQEIIKKYGDLHLTPGIEYARYLTENPNKIPEAIKDGNHYYLVGSTLYDKDGEVVIICMDWKEGKLSVFSGSLKDAWNEHDRIILLERMTNIF